MEFRSFDEILAMSGESKRKSVMAVAGAEKAAVIDAVLEAVEAGLTEPILVGEAGDIKNLLHERGKNVSDYNVVQTAAGQTPAERI